MKLLFVAAEGAPFQKRGAWETLLGHSLNPWLKKAMMFVSSSLTMTW